ncbi:MAG: hypothetical protein ACYCUD_08500 [Candidatus Dormibacteria bacterium]
MWQESSWADESIAELVEIEDADELCRRLVNSPWGWGSSSRCGEAVDLLARVRGTGTLPGSFLALLLCTCRRWDRVTAKLIAALEGSGMLAEADLDELAEAFLSEEVVIEYPFLWACPQGLAFEPPRPGEPAVHIGEHTMARTERHPAPPLRRWGAARTLRSDPGKLDGLLESASSLAPLHRDAVLHGLIDSAGSLDESDRRRLAERGLRCGVGRVRRAALDRLCELDGPEAAIRRARADTDRRVRAWRP